MSTFEKVFITDPLRENHRSIEKNMRIEISDEEMAARALGEALRNFNQISSLTEEVKPDEKDTRKTSKRKSKKNHRVSDKAAVESIQEKLP